MRSEPILSLTETIYDAASGAAPWRAVGEGLSRLVGATSASIMVGDVARGSVEMLHHTDFPADAVTAYRTHYRKVDLWTTRAAAQFARLPPGAPPRLLIGGELLVPDAEYVQSEFYNDFGRRIGLRHVIGTVAPLGAAGAMPLGLHRPDGAPPFGATERELLRATLPHLQRALQLRHRLGLAAGPAALDALPLGVLVVDAERAVLLANLAAEALAAAGRGLRLSRQRQHTLITPTIAAATHHADDAKLAMLVRGVARHHAAGGAVRLTAPDGTPGLAVLVSPVPRRLAVQAGPGRQHDQALLLLRDLDAGPAAPRAELLRDLFRLTPAEAAVAQLLAGGISKGAVAAARGLRETTVRSQVRALLDKTGAANLRDLERMLAALSGL